MNLRFPFGVLLLAATLLGHAEDAPPVTPLQTCAACHGEHGQGNALIGAPRLAGQQAEYLLLQLQGFKSGRRGYDSLDRYGAQMCAVVTRLDEAEFAPLALHYASLPSGNTGAVRASERAGATLYQGTCAGCHGPDGGGYALLKTPNLRILDAAYLERQLGHYAEGVRGGGAQADQHGTWMRGIALQVADTAQRKSLVDYIGSLAGTASH